ncbi:MULTISPECIES: hypothetical protein [unclassified Nocardioides]|uniref:hypothetical protein n=1 Tax=unclassified Nocardioides TaxID=2615069 RepID=UPI0006F33205|nr:MULTISPECIES: hypothetical protein [unclassified Nocardioides]KRA37624.1 hypothetical protein ASD81_02645 [Nocardioides sp. Root614]KRA91585.1 hypothetical protein ASD84_02910 [Nocardioides sp. Root682]
MIDRLRSRLRRGALDDTGAILVLAIIIVTVVALVTGLVLTRGDGSLRATIKLRAVAGTTYAADGAAQVVLNGLRTGYWDTADDAVGTVIPTNWVFTNEPGDGCFGQSKGGFVTEDDDLLLSSFYPATKSSGDAPTSAYVECVPEDATGAQGTVRHVSNANSPGDAIITLGNSGGENGLSNANKTLRVRGGIRSNSNISASGAIEVNDANVRARTGTCDNVTVSAGYTKSCPAGGGPSDPNYPADISTIPVLRTVPSCTGTYVELQPGYYDDAKALTDLTTGCNKIVWFRTGSYYFDFHNKSSNGDPLYENGITGAERDNIWKIAGTRVIGGELIGGGTPSGATTIPGACQNPISDAGAQGVQFIFGGDSRLMFDTDSLVELCATYRSTRPPIVVYGNKTGSNPTLTTLTGSAGGLTTSGTPTVTGTGSDPETFALNPETDPRPLVSPIPLTAAALQNDGNGIATWKRVGLTGTAGNETRTITMGGFAPPSTIDKGAVLKAARLVVRHRAASASTTASTIRITPSVAGSTTLGPFNLTRPTSLTTETIDLKTAQTTVYNALAKSIHDRGYTGASIDFTATANRNQSAQLDAIRLELEYYVPQMRGPAAISTNCTTTVGGCAAIDSATNGKGEPYLQGTTYVPLGKVYLNVANTNAQVFRWGIIARALHIDLNGAFKFTGAVIELPDNSPGLGLNGTLVQFNVYVCPNSPTCSATGKLALKVRAQVWDRDADASTTNDREVTIMSWSHQR